MTVIEASLDDCRLLDGRLTCDAVEETRGELARQRAEMKRRALEQGAAQERQLQEQALQLQKNIEFARQQDELDAFLWRHRAQDWFDGEKDAPDIVLQDTANQHSAFGTPAHWRSLILMTVLEGRIGQKLKYRQFLAPFFDRQGEHLRRCFPAVTGFLFVLRSAGYVWFDNINDWIDGDIIVLADYSQPPNEMRHAVCGRSPLVPHDTGRHLLIIDLETGEIVDRYRSLLPALTPQLARKLGLVPTPAS